MFELTDDYFAAQSVLVDHLATVNGIKQTYTLRQLSELKEKSQVTPSLHIAFHSEKLPDVAAGGTYTNTKQTWLVVLAVKQTEKDEGKLLTNVIKSLAGKNVGGVVWQREQSPVKPYFGKGYTYYPLAFTGAMRMKT